MAEESDPTRQPNRLAEGSSPYPLRHSRNPGDAGAGVRGDTRRNPDRFRPRRLYFNVARNSDSQAFAGSTASATFSQSTGRVRRSSALFT